MKLVLITKVAVTQESRCAECGKFYQVPWGLAVHKLEFSVQNSNFLKSVFFLFSFPRDLGAPSPLPLRLLCGLTHHRLHPCNFSASYNSYCGQLFRPVRTHQHRIAFQPQAKSSEDSFKSEPHCMHVGDVSGCSCCLHCTYTRVNPIISMVLFSHAFPEVCLAQPNQASTCMHFVFIPTQTLLFASFGNVFFFKARVEKMLITISAIAKLRRLRICFGFNEPVYEV